MVGGVSIALAAVVLPAAPAAAAPAPQTIVSGVSGGTCTSTAAEKWLRQNNIWYTICDFTSTGSFTLTPNTENTVRLQYVVVGGGGGGGGAGGPNTAGGGGGAGGVRQVTTLDAAVPFVDAGRGAQTFDVTVGTGGTSGSTGTDGGTPGGNGGESSIVRVGGGFTVTAPGGGGGGAGSVSGALDAANGRNAGGSGGGGGGGIGGGAGSGGESFGVGNDGGDAAVAYFLALGSGGGGGGVAGAGPNSNNPIQGGAGGLGLTLAANTWTKDSALHLAAGGGGGNTCFGNIFVPSSRGQGGQTPGGTIIGGAGGGAASTGGLGGCGAPLSATAGTANSGSGGGGGGYLAPATGSRAGGAGASGRVLVKFVTFPNNASAVATTNLANASGNVTLSWNSPNYVPSPSGLGNGTVDQYIVLYREKGATLWGIYSLSTPGAQPLSKILRPSCPQSPSWTCLLAYGELQPGKTYQFATTGQVLAPVAYNGQLNSDIGTGSSPAGIREVTVPSP